MRARRPPIPETTLPRSRKAMGRLAALPEPMVVSWQTLFVTMGLLALLMLLGCAGHRASAAAGEGAGTAEQGQTPAARFPVGPPEERPSAVGAERAETPAAAALASVLVDIPFQFDRYDLRFDARDRVEVDAQRLKELPWDHLLLEGRCDEVGTVDYNLVLGERRARTVQQYLLNLGLPASAMAIISYGKEQPFCLEHSEACWAQNRSVHFVVKGRAGSSR